MSDAAEQTLPLDGWHRARGARMVPFAGYAMPIQYEGIIAEHLLDARARPACSTSAIWASSLIAGAEAEKGLESLLPADLASLEEGRLRYSLLLNDDGGIVDDLMVTRRGGHFYMVVNGATKHGDIAHLRDQLPRGVVLDHMKEQALLALQGPKAVDGAGAAGAGRRGARLHDRRRLRARRRPGLDQPLGLYRRGRVRDFDRRRATPTTVADLLAEQPEVKPIGLGARDSLRLEAGLPLYGHDLDRETTPIEAGLAFAISKRAPRRGRLCRLASDHRASSATGRSASRVGLAVEGRQPVREGAMVVDAEGNEVGKVTSGGFSPSLEAPIAMAYVPLAAAAPGTRGRRSPQRGKLFAGDGRRRCRSFPTATTAREPPDERLLHQGA